MVKTKNTGNNSRKNSNILLPKQAINPMKDTVNHPMVGRTGFNRALMVGGDLDLGTLLLLFMSEKTYQSNFKPSSSVLVRKYKPKNATSVDGMPLIALYPKSAL